MPLKGADKMNIEVRSDGLHISGYVNVTGKLSRPVLTPHGKVTRKESMQQRRADTLKTKKCENSEEICFFIKRK